MTHICVGNLTIIGPDNGLSPGRRQAIIWTNAGILLIGAWGTNFSEILIEIHTFSFNKMRLKMSSAKWRPFCLGLNVLIAVCKWDTAWTIIHLRYVNMWNVLGIKLMLTSSKVVHYRGCPVTQDLTTLEIRLPWATRFCQRQPLLTNGNLKLNQVPDILN